MQGVGLLLSDPPGLRARCEHRARIRRDTRPPHWRPCWSAPPPPACPPRFARLPTTARYSSSLHQSKHQSKQNKKKRKKKKKLNSSHFVSNSSQFTCHVQFLFIFFHSSSFAQCQQESTQDPTWLVVEGLHAVAVRLAATPRA
jgi:hypothetical protein